MNSRAGGYKLFYFDPLPSLPPFSRSKMGEGETTGWIKTIFF
jgi:hypothetical protein